MPLEKFKDITIEGREFRVGLVTALTGDWIINQITNSKASEADVYSKIQNHILEKCSVYHETGGTHIPKPIYAAGTWLVKDLDLEYDTETVHELVEAGLEFNVGPFLRKLMAKLTKAALLAAGTQPSA